MVVTFIDVVESSFGREAEVEDVSIPTFIHLVFREVTFEQSCVRQLSIDKGYLLVRIEDPFGVSCIIKDVRLDAWEYIVKHT